MEGSVLVPIVLKILFATLASILMSGQEHMTEGASNCVKRHLNLNDCDTFLIWS